MSNEPDNIRYVQIQDPSSGWPTMVKTVREADVNKIDDCKEDIDTLLVFAGLYSAVLSAFIIESYRMLQQDNQDVMVGLMRQLVAQNFTSGPGFLNSTTPAPDIPDFEPPLWAIRVNVLWFISLILSLAAASFGMLVKQWLREYLALEYTTPQQRLRARQYRSPALSKWKVFEIAAFLPVLLQISLGLFFIGLCFFTSAIHSSVKSCTIPVVCAWAFFLLITTIAPLFSPRCPFKTTFLKTPLRVGRRYIAPGFRHATLFLIEVTLLVGRSIRHILNDGSLSRKLRKAVSVIRVAVAPLRERIHLSMRHPYGALRGMWDGTIGARMKAWDQYVSTRITDALLEEEELVKTEQEDTEILTSVDAFMSDDGLLPVMVDTVQHQTDPTSIVAFVLQILGRRLGRDLPTQNLDRILEFNALSKRAWSATTDAIAATLRRHYPRPMKAGSPLWVHDAVIILLSHSPHPLSQLAVGALRDVIAHDDSYCIELGNRLSGSAAAKDTFPGLSTQLLRLREVQAGIVAPLSLMQIYIAFLCPDHPHTSLFQVFRQHEPNDLTSSSPCILNDLFDFMITMSRWLVSRAYKACAGEGELVQIILQYSGRFGRPHDAIALCSQLTLQWDYVPWVMFPFAALHSKRRISDDQEYVFLDTYSSCGHHDRDQMVKNMAGTLENLCNGSFDDAADWDRIDVVRLCRLQLKTYFGAEHRNEDVWRDLWTQYARAIERYYDTTGWDAEPIEWPWSPDTPISTPDELFEDDQALACECLAIIVSHPEAYTTVDQQSEGSIPTELVAALWLFATREAKEQFDQLQQTLLLLTDMGSGEPEEDAEGSDAERDNDEDEENGGGKKVDGAESEDDLEDAGSGHEAIGGIAEVDEDEQRALQGLVGVDEGVSTPRAVS